MDIAIVAHNHDRREGTGGYTAELVAHLALSHQVTLYAAGVWAQPPAGVHVVKVPAMRKRAYTTILTFPLGYWMKRGRHDVVHAQGWVAASADVVTAHVCLAAWRDALRASGQQDTGAERWLGDWVAMQEAELMNRARIVVVPSNKVKRELAEYYGRKNDVAVIPHGFPKPRLLEDRHEARSTLGLPRDGFVALYVGEARKGLLNAIAAVLASKGVHLLVVSRQKVAAGTGEARIHWRTKIPSIETCYAAADVLLHPTIYDSFGMTVSEAMAFGLPVIVSEHAGVSELIDHGRSGWVVRGDLKHESAKALARLAGDPGLREVLAVGARLVAKEHDWDVALKDTIDVYHRAAGH